MAELLVAAGAEVSLLCCYLLLMVFLLLMLLLLLLATAGICCLFLLLFACMLLLLLMLLLLQQTQVNRRGIHHCTSLLWAAGKGSLSLVQLLLRLVFRTGPGSDFDCDSDVGELPILSDMGPKWTQETSMGQLPSSGLAGCQLFIAKPIHTDTLIGFIQYSHRLCAFMRPLKH